MHKRRSSREGELGSEVIFSNHSGFSEGWGVTSYAARMIQSCGVVINHNGESIRAADITHRHLKAWGIEDIHTYPPNYTIYTVPNLGDFIFKGDYVAEIRLVVGANATIVKGESFSLPIAVCDIRAMLGKPEVHAGHREPVFWIGP